MRVDDMGDAVEQVAIRAARRRLDAMSLEERLDLRQSEGVPLDEQNEPSTAEIADRIRGGNR